MDAKIFKAILCSCESVSKDLDQIEDLQKSEETEKFLPRSEIVFTALCTSLTNLLCYNVSKGAYQRYSVRLHIIEVIRNWCRITEKFEHLEAFTDEKQTLTFVELLLSKHLTDDVLDNCRSYENLLKLTGALVCLASKNVDYTQHAERLLLRLLEYEPSNQGEDLLCYVISGQSNLILNQITTENIYISQKSKLVEQPLLDNFVLISTNENQDTRNSEHAPFLDQLLEIASTSSRIFCLVCIFLKELLRELDYAPAGINFIQSILKCIAVHCKNKDTDILDLYPRTLHSCIILLRIDPSHHSLDSKNATLRMLGDMFTDSKDNVVILLSHFPAWLKLFEQYVVKNSL